MFDEEFLKAKIEERLKKYKQTTDKYGITWVEVNGQKFSKNNLFRLVLKWKDKNKKRPRFSFLSF